MPAVVLYLLTATFLGAAIVLGWLLLQARQKLARYSDISDVEAHKEAVAREANKLSVKAESLQASVAGLEAEYDAKRTKAEAKRLKQEQELTATLSTLRAELEQVEESLDLQSFGLYRTQYGFEHIDEYKRRLDDVRAQQKALVKADHAAVCSREWRVEGSAKEGRKMVKEQIKLMLRAFNGECDASIAKVKYNNVTRLDARIRKAFDALNKLGQTKAVYLTPQYLELKLAELYLVHEHREAVQRDKEEQAEIRRQMREEEKAQREIEKAQAQAEKEEALREKALEKARAELQAASGAQLAKFEGLVAKLESELQDALDRKAKAIARAQLTRSGHVYVLSNIGSFGENLFKIGMTRRLEPQERVKELGDASVPFGFDVHAMIYTEDAPGLERTLHQEFTHRRVNLVNHRKEFFRVTIEEIRQAVAKHHGIVTFVMSAEAEEYRKSHAMLEAGAEATG